MGVLLGIVSIQVYDGAFVIEHLFCLIKPTVLCKCRWSANPSGGDLESLGYKEGFRVDVDVPEGTWAEAPHFHDILIFNTGHW